MTATFHLLTGEYPPERGGVGDYTHLVAQALATRGCAVHVWCPSLDPVAQSQRIHLHRLPDVFGAQSRRVLGDVFAATPGCVLLQYVPNALGAGGANLPFCLWLLRLGRTVDVRIMFHEPYFYFGWQSPLRNLLALTQRLMAGVLLRAGVRSYLSTESWKRYLRPWAPSEAVMITLPVPSTVPREADARAVSRWRAQFARPSLDVPVVGHFGTFGDHMGRELREAIPAILVANPAARFVCLGRGSNAFAASIGAAHPLLRERIQATGPLPGDEVAAALRACDLVVQPYPDGVTTRRTSVMASLANQVATVTTWGFLSEPVWAETGAVALAPARDARAIAAATHALLCDRERRLALAETGSRVYDQRFALECTIDTLLEPVGAGAT